MRKDLAKILLLYLLSLAIVYGLPRLGAPHFLSQVFFLGLIAAAFNSRDNLLWLTWFFVVIDAPAGIFASQSGTELFRLPFYNIAPGISLGFQELFLFMFILKWLLNRNRALFAFKYQIWFIIILGGVYFIISFFLGTSAASIIMTVRSILPWFWLLIIPTYIRDSDDLERVFALLIPFVVIAFASSIQTYFTGQFLRGLLSGTASISRFGEATQESLMRVASSFFIVFISIIQSLYMIISGNRTFKVRTLLLVIAIGTLTILLSGTRGWIIALIILYLSLFFVPGFSTLLTTLRALVVIALVFIFMSAFFPILPYQVGLSFERVLTLRALAEGDLTAGGTLSRLTERGPRVLAVWRESPFLGWAFSDRFYDYADVHVGNQTNLLNLGILGFTLFNGIFIFIMHKMYKWGRKLKRTFTGGNEYIVYLFAMLALFFIHSSSGVLWSFLHAGSPHSAQMLWGLLFTAMSVSILPSRNKPIQLAHSAQ